MAAEQQQQPAIVAGGSRFAVTCGLLRQYMKEQGGNGARCLAPAAVAMGLVPGADAAAEDRTTVLELFPQQAGTLKDEQQRKRTEPGERAPLTIFYGDKMVVFDDFPAEKADELMHLAGSGNAAAQNALGQPNLTDMPIARKASLKRFLEKRKNRLTAGDPYPAAASESSTKPAVKEEGAPWLGANSVLSLS
ncbi:Protein TIFY 11c [Dichanthelium oligosanthes]|uniref:Protein TIFY n=1 Tax=Dichanthelium oligosanthes TaxID=888268 RepID=A0A1E5V3C9_9POAL|nr:Protein TIFY 11c [Dichanthelium oligosanthes]